MKGKLPKAYLRVDPNLDQTHPDPGGFLRLLCAANRQPCRGRFKSRELLEAVLGAELAGALVDRGDLKKVGKALEVDGWALWQEGDVTVGERMRRFRSRVRNGAVPEPSLERNAAVTEPLPGRIPASEALGQQGIETEKATPPPRRPAGRREEGIVPAGEATCPACGVKAITQSTVGRPGWFCGTGKGGCDFKFALDDEAIVSQLRPRETEEDEPEAPACDPAAAQLWRDALAALAVDTSSPFVGRSCGVEANDNPPDLVVWCPSEVEVGWILNSWGERLRELLNPRTLKLIHGRT